jgi:hypothetical protein
MSRAAYYPPANRTAQNFQPSLGRPAMRTVNVLVLHTTEGSSWPGYEGGRQAPTFTINCTSGKPQVRQHFPLPRAAMALVQPSGSLSTNRNNVAQVELVGTGGWATPANPRRPYTVSGPHTNWASPDQMMLKAVADLIAWLHKEWEVPLRAPYAFDDWRGNNSHRMTASQWSSFTGVCGHSHVWGNEHTDPGSFPIAACLRLAAGGTTTTIQEDDMPSVSDIWNGKLPFKATPADDRLTAGRLLDEAATQATYATNHARAAEAGIKGAQVQLHKDNTTTQNSIANVRSDVAKLGSDVADIKAAIAALAEKIGG